MKKRAPSLLPYVLIGIMFIPFLQNITGLFPERKLEGKQQALAPPPGFSLSGWLSASWQDSVYAYTNAHFGFRNWLLCFNNQLAYSCWNKAKANSLIIGANNCLLNTTSIKARNGNDFIGEDSIRHMTARMKRLQELLAEREVSLVVVVIPGKANYYPEYIPSYFPKEMKRTNREALATAAAESGLNFIDLTPRFLELKQKENYPLFSLYGFHWSEYGMLQGTDSINRYIGRLLHQPMPDLVITGGTWTDSLRYTDDDLMKGMNLLFDLPKTRMYYPAYHFNTAGKSKPRLLTVGDSFWWNEFVSPADTGVFSDSHFWFYFNEFHTHQSGILAREQVKIADEIGSRNVILLISSDINIPKIGWGFVEAAIAALPPETNERMKKIIQTEKRILSDENWMKVIREKAGKEGIPVDSMLRRDAIYVLEEESKS